MLLDILLLDVSWSQPSLSTNLIVIQKFVIKNEKWVKGVTDNDCVYTVLQYTAVPRILDWIKDSNESVVYHLIVNQPYTNSRDINLLGTCKKIVTVFPNFFCLRSQWMLTACRYISSSRNQNGSHTTNVESFSSSRRSRQPPSLLMYKFQLWGDTNQKTAAS